jgi:hypothetical protein
MRFSDGRLMHHDGASWSLVGTYAPTDWGGEGNARHRYRNHGCFVYRGKLHTRWLGFNETNIGTKSFIGAFNGSDVTQQAAITNPDYNPEVWGNVFQYKGRCYWFAQQAYMVNDVRGYMYLYTFYYDGSGNPIFTKRQVSEMGNLGFGGGTLTGDEAHHSASMPRVIPHRDRMLMTNSLGPVSYYSSGVYRLFWNLNATIDIDGSGNVDSDLVITSDVNNKFTSVLMNPDSVGTYHTSMFNAKLASASWNDKIYVLTPGNRVYAYDPDDGSRTLAFDISEDAAFEMSGGTHITDQAAVSGFHLEWDTGITPTNGGRGTPWQSQGLGTRIKVLNYNGTPSNTKMGWIYHTLNYSGEAVFIKAVDDSGVPFAAQPSGTQFKAYWNFAGAAAGEHSYVFRFAHMFVHANKLYILGVAGRIIQDTSPSWDNANHHPKWTLTVWDGTNPPTTTAYTPAGHRDVSGLSVALDESSNELHFFVDRWQAQTVHHFSIVLTSPFTLVDRGSIYTKSTVESTHKMGLITDSVAMYDQGDVTATIESRSVDATAGTITITYKLWGANSDTADVGIQFNTGDDDGVEWTECTRKGVLGEGKTGLTSTPGGTTHTFVHDAALDLGGTYVGTVQHRIGITTQTRN